MSVVILFPVFNGFGKQFFPSRLSFYKKYGLVLTSVKFHFCTISIKCNFCSPLAYHNSLDYKNPGKYFVMLCVYK